MTFNSAFSRPPIPLTEGSPPPALGQSGDPGPAAGVAPRGNPGVPPHPGRLRLHPRFRNYSIPLQLQQTGTKISVPRGDTAPYQAHRLIADWLGLMNPPLPGEDRAPSPDHQSFYRPTNPTNRGRKRWWPGSTPPRRLWEPHPTR